MGDEEFQNYVDPSLWENGINAATLSLTSTLIAVKIQIIQMIAFIHVQWWRQFRGLASA